MEACDIDQFEMHLRAVLGLPCPTPTMRVGAALMVNILGETTMPETMVYNTCIFFTCLILRKTSLFLFLS